jgi:hypothetical protein
VYNCESGQKFLSELDASQIAMVWPYIDSEVWMKKFSDYNKSGMAWNKNESYQRMMVLAGIINEEGMLQRGVAAVKKFVTNAKNAAQNFLTGLTNKLTQFGSSIGAIFATPENMNKLKDGREHTFVIKNGKIQIN